MDTLYNIFFKKYNSLKHNVFSTLIIIGKGFKTIIIGQNTSILDNTKTVIIQSAVN